MCTCPFPTCMLHAPLRRPMLPEAVASRALTAWIHQPSPTLCFCCFFGSWRDRFVPGCLPSRFSRITVQTGHTGTCPIQCRVYVRDRFVLCVWRAGRPPAVHRQSKHPGYMFRQTAGQAGLPLDVGSYSGPDSKAWKFNFRVVSVSSAIVGWQRYQLVGVVCTSPR